MRIALNEIATPKQQRVIAQIEYRLGERFNGKTSKDVWNFINKHYNELAEVSQAQDEDYAMKEYYKETRDWIKGR